jgi:hypothetical protein
LGEKTSSNWMGATNWVTGITLWEKCVLNGNIHKSCDFPFVVIVWFPDAIYIVYIYTHIFNAAGKKTINEIVHLFPCMIYIYIYYIIKL